MKKNILKLYNRVGIESDRTKNITKHIIVSFLYRGGSILSSLFLVPLTINFLDTENYGIWLTLSSFIGWFSFFDIGLGNGLRNKFAEAKSKGDLTLAQGYVSTAYYTIGAVTLGIFLIFLWLNFFIDWTKVLNTTLDLNSELSILMPIVFGFFCLQLVVKLITTIYTADQHHSMQGKVGFYSSALSLLAIWLMTHFAKSSLLIFGTIFSALPVLLLVGLNVFAFSNRYKIYRPSIILWKKENLKDIFGLGIKFFILQICGIVLYTSDNLIISKLFTPAAVVPYNIAFKYYSIASMAFSIIIAPYWSTITEASQKEDWEWIKTAMNNLLRFVFFTIIIIFCMMLLSNEIITLWVGNKIIISTSLSILMGIFFILTTIISPFTIFLNGIGKVKIQVFQAVFTALINIPLSIYFAHNLNMGPKGVILSTIFCSIPGLILAPLQYKKIITNKATGLWSK